MKKLFLAAVFVALTLYGAWLIVLPESLIINLAKDALARQGLRLEENDFRKGLFFNVTASSLFLSPLKGTGPVPVFMLEGVEAHLSIPSVFRLGPLVEFTASMAGGKIVGTATASRRPKLDMKGDGIMLSRLKAVSDIGVRGEGNLSFILHFAEGKGEAKLLIESIKAESLATGRIFLPLDLVREVNGVISFHDGMLDIKSLVAGGKGISVKVKGVVRGNDLDLQAEITMDASLEAGYVYRALLFRYMVSPGYYVVPLKTRYPE